MTWRRKLSGRASTGVRWIISAAAMALIVLLFPRLVDVPAALRAVQQSDGRLDLLAALAFVAGLLAYAQRWRLLLAGKPGLGETLQAANAGHAANIVLPFRAGEALRVAMLGRSAALPLAEITASVVVERGIEQLMRVLALAGALVSGLRLQLAPAALIGVGGILVLLTWFAVWALRHQADILAQGPRLLARVPRLSEARARQGLAAALAGINDAAASGQMRRALGWSVITWSCFWAFQMLTLAALNGAGLASSSWAALCLGVLFIAPPSAATQPGIYHAALVAPLALLGFDRAGLTAFAVLLHLQQMLWMIGLALVGSGLQVIRRAI